MLPTNLFKKLNFPKNIFKKFIIDFKIIILKYEKVFNLCFFTILYLLTTSIKPNLNDVR